MLIIRGKDEWRTDNQKMKVAQDCIRLLWTSRTNESQKWRFNTFIHLKQRSFGISETVIMIDAEKLIKISRGDDFLLLETKI